MEPNDKYLAIVEAMREAGLKATVRFYEDGRFKEAVAQINRPRFDRAFIFLLEHPFFRCSEKHHDRSIFGDNVLDNPAFFDAEQWRRLKRGLKGF